MVTALDFKSALRRHVGSSSAAVGSNRFSKVSPPFHRDEYRDSTSNKVLAVTFPIPASQ